MPRLGLVRLAASVGRWQRGWHDDGTQPLPWLPLPGRGGRVAGYAVQHLAEHQPVLLARRALPARLDRQEAGDAGERGDDVVAAIGGVARLLAIA